jgi:hypothetical protein
MRWWRSEKKAKEAVEKTKSEALLVAQRVQDFKEPATKDTEEKELIPAE